jgi:hypothetical protein
VLLAVDERLLWRVYDCDLLEEGIATGILKIYFFPFLWFNADFHSVLLLGKALLW